MVTQDEVINRRIRVFVSSTFRDMMEERNILMTHTWPELRRFCRERQVELVEVDLRWGIAEEQSTRKETLKLCLDEIRTCRPYFVCLLGERYGWVPGDDAFTADLKEEQPWLKDLHGKSVTELEILHGVLNNPEMADRAFFYFRDPKYADTISEEKKSDFLSEDLASAARQTSLKNLIRATCALKNIQLIETYPDPQTLAPIILEQLKDAIDKQFPKEDIPDPLTREARDHEAYAEIRRRTYIGRPDYFNALDNHCKSDGKPLLLLGDSGSGKSALIANWVEHWRKEHPEDYIFQHYIGGTTDSAVHWKVMTRLMSVIKMWSGDNEALPHTNDEILRDFTIWLSKARIKAEHDGVRFIIILDALNQLEETDHAHALGWLPEEPFKGNLRLIISTLIGSALEALEKRSLSVLKIEPLTSNEQVGMITNYLKHFGKSLDRSRIERVLNVKASANPLYLKILLDELRVTGTHENLGERLDDYLKSEDITSLLRNVLARYQRDYERDRKGIVSDALGLIWSARRGLTESELLQLLRPENKPQLPLATWSPLRAALEESLIDRGGIFNFAHDFLRSAVETAFVSDPQKKDNYRIKLADYFEAQPINTRKCEELPWLLQKTGNKERLNICILNIDCFKIILHQEPFELMHYWSYLGIYHTIGKAYVNSFNSWETKIGGKIEDIFQAATSLGLFLDSYNFPNEAEKMLKHAIAIGERYPGYDDSELAVAHNNLGLVMKGMGNFIEAEYHYQKAVELTKLKENSNHYLDTPFMINLAQLYEAKGNIVDAEKINREILAFREQKYGSDGRNIETVLNNLAVCLLKLDQFAEAELLIQRSLTIREKYFGKNHPIVGNSLNNLGAVYAESGKFDKAEKLFQQSINILSAVFPDDHPILKRTKTSLDNLMLKKLLGTNLYAGGKVSDEENRGKAIDIYNKACKASKSGNYKTAEVLLTDAILLQKDFEDAYYNRAEARIALGNYDGAVEDCSKVIQLNTKAADAYLTRGAAKAFKKDYPGCIEDTGQSIVLGISNPIAYYNRGMAYYFISKKNEAISDLIQFLILSPDDERVHSVYEVFASLNTDNK